MLTDKVADVLGSKAEIVVAADDSCLMHIAGGLERQRAGVRPLHLAQVLAGTEAGSIPGAAACTATRRESRHEQPHSTAVPPPGTRGAGRLAAAP
jgi:L-lactate dehydrogenase complex protein LldE